MKNNILDVRAYTVDGEGNGGDYHNQSEGHWIVDTDIANPMSAYDQYKKSRTSWGINVLGSIFVEIEYVDGTVGVSTGFGGIPACYMIEEHFKRFLIGTNPRNINTIWEQMFRASMFYGRKGVTMAAISVVDLALWDLLGKLHQEPVFNLIGGKTQDEIPFYCTGPEPTAVKDMGFFGSKVPLPFAPSEGHAGLKKNVEFLTAHRESVGSDYPLMVDCYMALNVPYAIELATACEHLNINWWEEVLHPDDFDGFKLLKQAHPRKKWTTGEHEYSRYGFRKLIEGRCVDILQPDVMWLGGLTELLRVSAMASAYDIPVVPHGSGPYSSHFVVSQPNSPFCEYIANSPDGKSILPVFGSLFSDEQLPVNGKVNVNDSVGFGLSLSDSASLKRYISNNN
jgi:L-rhamnonate dehydratase